MICIYFIMCMQKIEAGSNSSKQDLIVIIIDMSERCAEAQSHKTK